MEEKRGSHLCHNHRTGATPGQIKKNERFLVKEEESHHRGEKKGRVLPTSGTGGPDHFQKVPFSGKKPFVIRR